MKEILTFDTSITLLFNDRRASYLTRGLVLNQSIVLVGTPSPVCWRLREESQKVKEVLIKCQGNVIINPLMGNWIGDPIGNNIAKDYVEWKEATVKSDNKDHRRLVIRNYIDGSALVYDRHRPDLAVNDFARSLRTAKERLAYPCGYLIMKGVNPVADETLKVGIKLRWPGHTIHDKENWS